MSLRRFLPTALLLISSALRAANPDLPPDVKGASVVVIDAASGDVLYQRNPGEKRPVASTQKLLTSLIVAEQGNLGKEVVIEPIDEITEPTTLQLKPGSS
jgi:D-alanyl-D-alanine carboxypeptidase